MPGCISKVTQLKTSCRVPEAVHGFLAERLRGCRPAGYAQLAGWRAGKGAKQSRTWLLGCGLVIALPGLLLVALASSLVQAFPELADPLLAWNRLWRFSLYLPQPLLSGHAFLVELINKAQSFYAALPLEALLRWLRMEFMLKRTLSLMAGQIAQLARQLAVPRARLLAGQLGGRSWALARVKSSF